MSNLYSRFCTDCLVSLGYIPHVYLTRMEHQIHRTTPPHTLPVFYLWFFLHNKQCSPNFCVVFSTAISIYTNFLTPKQPPDRMPNQIRTSHLAKIRLTTHRIFRSQHALGVNVLLQPYGREQFALTPLTLILDGFLIVSTTLLFMFKYAMFCHVDNFDST
jgi:hypothetical protein